MEKSTRTEINRFAKMRRIAKANERNGIPSSPELIGDLLRTDDHLAKTCDGWNRNYPENLVKLVIGETIEHE